MAQEQVVVKFGRRSSPYPRYQAGDVAILTPEEAEEHVAAGNATITAVGVTEEARRAGTQRIDGETGRLVMIERNEDGEVTGETFVDPPEPSRLAKEAAEARAEQEAEVERRARGVVSDPEPTRHTDVPRGRGQQPARTTKMNTTRITS